MADYGDKMKKRILFVTYGGAHVNLLLSVIQSLRKNKNHDIHVLGLTTAATTLDRHEIPYFGFSDLLGEYNESVRKLGERLAAEFASDQMVSHEETVAYLGLSYFDLEKRLGIEKAAELYKEKGRQAFLPLTILTKLLKKLQPDLVVTTNSPRAERAAVLSAAQLGIRCVCTLDMFATHAYDWIKRSDYANKLCVLSEGVKTQLTTLGRSHQDIVVTGNPMFDCLRDPVLESQKNQLMKEKGWRKQFGVMKKILWASQPEPENHPFTNEKALYPDLPIQVEKTLLMLVERHPDWYLIIRPHPNEYSRLSHLPERVELSDQTDHLAALLSAVDVVVTITSTVGLYAVYLKKPLITIDLSVTSPYVPYAKMGLSQGITDLTQLEDTIETAVSGSHTKIKELPEPGQATDRVVEVIKFELDRGIKE